MNMLLLISFLFHHTATYNQDILAYAESHVGKKVGKGVCHELIDSAIIRVDHDYKRKYREKGNYVKLFHRILKSQVRPGDVLIITNCDWHYDPSNYKKFFFISGHIAVIKSINGNFITVLEQNTARTLKESRVIERIYDISEWHSHINGSISYRRYE